MYFRVWILIMSQTHGMLRLEESLQKTRAARQLLSFRKSSNILSAWITVGIQTRRYIWYLFYKFTVDEKQSLYQHVDKVSNFLRINYQSETSFRR